MRLRVIAWLGLSLLPGMADAAIGCHGQAFGAVSRPFTGIDRYEDAFRIVVPYGVPEPAHAITAASENWGCQSALTVDLDRSTLWSMLHCSSDDAFDRDVSSPMWRGATIGQHRNGKGVMVREAAREVHLFPTEIAELVCLANDAWMLGKWAEPMVYDAEGKPVVGTPPLPASPHGFGYMRLKDGGVERVLGGYYDVPAAGVAERLQKRMFEDVH